MQCRFIQAVPKHHVSVLVMSQADQRVVKLDGRRQVVQAAALPPLDYRQRLETLPQHHIDPPPSAMVHSAPDHPAHDRVKIVAIGASVRSEEHTSELQSLR